MLSIDQLWELALFVTPLRIYYAFLALSLIAYIAYRMQTKHFYIVRHGQTVLNEQQIKQGPEGGLSDTGRVQAQSLGKALAEVTPRIQHIYSSSYERARETSRIIASQLHVGVSYTRLLVERRNPSEIIGKPVDYPDVHRITGLIEKGFHEDTYRFSDEENFNDLLRRARRARRYLQNRLAVRACVVTHHAFLQMFLSSLLYDTELNAKLYATLAFYNPSDNAGVTICIFHPWKSLVSKTHGWEIVGYNQHVESHS